MSAAEWAVQASEKTDQDWAAALEIAERDLAVAGDGVEDHLRRAVARLERSVD